MKVVYQGPQDRIMLAPQQIMLLRGEPQDVPDDVAERLIAQGTVARWTPARERTSRARAADANPEVESR